jgi:hypothetical protein
MALMKDATILLIMAVGVLLCLAALFFDAGWFG